MLLSYYWQESLEIFSSSAHNIQGLNREFFLKMKETLTEKKLLLFTACKIEEHLKLTTTKERSYISSKNLKW